MGAFFAVTRGGNWVKAFAQNRICRMSIFQIVRRLVYTNQRRNTHAQHARVVHTGRQIWVMADSVHNKLLRMDVLLLHNIYIVENIKYMSDR